MKKDVFLKCVGVIKNELMELAAVNCHRRLFLAGGISTQVRKISNGCLGDSCDHITLNLQQTPREQ